MDGYRKELLDAFIDKRVTSIEMVDCGLKWAARHSEENDFIPPPHRFARKCQGSEFPAPEEAYHIAGKQVGKHPKHRNWRHDVVKWAAGEIDTFDLQTKTEREMLPRFKAVYKSVCDRYAAGERFTVPEERRIEETEAPLTSKETNIKNIAGLLAGFD